MLRQVKRAEQGGRVVLTEENTEGGYFTSVKVDLTTRFVSDTSMTRAGAAMTHNRTVRRWIGYDATPDMYIFSVEDVAPSFQEV